MNVSVIHTSLNQYRGGAEQVCLAVIEALNERGHKVCLGTLEKTDWSKMNESFGDVVRPDKEIFATRNISSLGIYGEMLSLYFIAIKTYKQADVIFHTLERMLYYGLPLKKLIVYLHGEEVKRAIISKKYRKGLWRFYYTPYSLLKQKSIIKIRNSAHTFTNSSFSANAIKETFNMDAKVLWPPVNIENFHPNKKQNLVVSVGRFDRTKNHETLIKSFRNVDTASCVIIGNSSGKESELYILKLKSLIRKLGLKERIKLLVDCPFNSLKNLLSKAKVYVHSMPFEPFGISVVEAMAAGCVPIVHKRSGTNIEIVENDKYGFSFEDVTELSEKINLILENEDLRKKYSTKAVQRSRIFGKKVFKKRILHAVESF